MHAVPLQSCLLASMRIETQNWGTSALVGDNAESDFTSCHLYDLPKMARQIRHIIPIDPRICLWSSRDLEAARWRPPRLVTGLQAMWLPAAHSAWQHELLHGQRFEDLCRHAGSEYRTCTHQHRAGEDGDSPDSPSGHQRQVCCPGHGACPAYPAVDMTVQGQLLRRLDRGTLA